MIASLADLSTVAADIRAVVAALDNENDPNLRERLDAVLDRVTKIEETIALLMDNDVEDQPFPEMGQDPERMPVAAGVTDSPPDGATLSPDGNFPIDNIADLHNAVRAIGRAKDKAAAKAWIKKRAAELGAEGVLPDTWE